VTLGGFKPGNLDGGKLESSFENLSLDSGIGPNMRKPLLKPEPGSLDKLWSSRPSSRSSACYSIDKYNSNSFSTWNPTQPRPPSFLYGFGASYYTRPMSDSPLGFSNVTNVGFITNFPPIWQSPVDHSGARSVRSSSGNTCSRFARNDSDLSLKTSRLSDSRTSRSFEDSYDDDDAYEDCKESFTTARTSFTRRSTSTEKVDSIRSSSSRSNLDCRSKIRSSPRIRNLCPDVIQEKMGRDNPRSFVSKMGWFTVRLFQYLFLFVGVISMFIIFGMLHDELGKTEPLFRMKSL